MYRKLIEFHQQGRISFRYVKTFNMDEYVNLPRDHPESYHYFMWHNFFKHIDILPENVHILDGNAPDLQAECDAYEAKIKEAGGVHLFIGGLLPSMNAFVYWLTCALIQVSAQTGTLPLTSRDRRSCPGKLRVLSRYVISD